MVGELTIVIPAKNEVAMLPRLLESLCRQDYAGMNGTRVLVADAGSTDGTVAGGAGFSRPARGRDGAGWAAFGRAECRSEAGDDEVCAVSGCRCGVAGADSAATGAVEDGAARAASGNDEYCLPEGGFFDDLLYAGNNLMQRVGSFDQAVCDGDVHAVRS